MSADASGSFVSQVAVAIELGVFLSLGVEADPGEPSVVEGKLGGPAQATES